MKKYWIILLIVTSCVKPYDFEANDFRRALVIDALLTNQIGEQFVRLAYTYALDGYAPEPVTGAQVVVIDNFGNSERFYEVNAGLYQPEASFVGIPGRTYLLTIETANGQTYQSTQETLLTPAPIVNIYGRFLSLRSETSDGFDRGVQFLVDIESVDDEPHNYRFQYEEDYEVEVPFGSLLEYNRATSTIDRREQSIKLCYIHQPSYDLQIATTAGQISNDLLEFPIDFSNENEVELLGRYSIKIKNYRISSEAYQYYKDLKENNESSGSFFDRQKGSLIGNIQNTGNVSEPVLGYFEVAGVSEAYRIFEAGTWKDEGFRPGAILTGCSEMLMPVPTVDILAGTYNFGNKLIYNFENTEGLVPGTTYNTELLLIPSACGDCRNYGNLEKPEFWN